MGVKNCFGDDGCVKLDAEARIVGKAGRNGRGGWRRGGVRGHVQSMRVGSCACCDASVLTVLRVQKIHNSGRIRYSILQNQRRSRMQRDPQTLTRHKSKLLDRLPREVGKDSRVRQTVLPQSRCELERGLLRSGGEENVRHDDGRNNEGRGNKRKSQSKRV